MENRVMKYKVTDKEQESVKRFFDKLYDKSVQKGASFFLCVIFIFLIMILCLMPVQEFMADGEENPLLMPFVMILFSSMMVNMRTLFFKQYTENQKSRTMREILQYYPVSKKAVWKHKMMDLLPFLAKVTSVGLILQLIVTFIVYKTVSWMNFAYVVGGVFFFPILGELIFDGIMKTYVEE